MDFRSRSFSLSPVLAIVVAWFVWKYRAPNFMPKSCRWAKNWEVFVMDSNGLLLGQISSFPYVHPSWVQACCKWSLGIHCRKKYSDTVLVLIKIKVLLWGHLVAANHCGIVAELGSWQRTKTRTERPNILTSVYKMHASTKSGFWD